MSTLLATEIRGEGPPLLLLHGFTGSSQTWRPFAEAWTGFRQIAVDLPGHGGSGAPAAGYGMDDCVADLLRLLDTFELERAAVLGYSMGGRVALRLALHAPERVQALVLESASPGIDSAPERAARIEADEQLARMVEQDGVEAFVRHWESIPLFASQAALPEAVRRRQREARLRCSPDGLAASLHSMGAGRDESILPLLHKLTAPVLLIAGSLDTKYVCLARQMEGRLANAEVQIVEGCGHAVHLERPERFGNAVERFLIEHIITDEERHAS